MTNPFGTAGTAGAADAGDPFGDPAPQAERPRLRDLIGRLLLVIPHKLEEGIPNRLQPGTVQDRLTADVVVLDGGELEYGGRPEKGVPHSKKAKLPFKSDRMYLSQRGIVSQSMEALAKKMRGQPGMVLGRLGFGEATEAGREAPYLLSKATDADKDIARQYLASVDPFS